MTGGKFRSVTKVNRSLNSTSITYHSQDGSFIYTVCIYTRNKNGILPSRNKVAYNSIIALKHVLDEVRIREKFWTPEKRKKYDNLEQIINNIKTEKQNNK